MSFILRAIPQPSLVVRTSSFPLVYFRGISDKYHAPYPPLPKAGSSGTDIQESMRPAAGNSNTGPSDGIFGGITFLGEQRELTTADRWVSVHEAAQRLPPNPGNVYTGRSVPINEKAGVDLPAAYRRLHVILARNHVRPELFLQRRYEKPSDRERRLKSERHRRRFAAWIRKKVQLVSEIRRRG